MNINLLLNLQRLRTNSNLTLEQFSQLVGIETTRLQDIEKGNVEPTMEELKLIASFYGMAPSELFNVNNNYVANTNDQYVNKKGKKQTQTKIQKFYSNPKKLHITALVFTLIALISFFALPIFHNGYLYTTFYLMMTRGEAHKVILSLLILLILIYTVINSIINISLKKVTTSSYSIVSKFLSISLHIVCLVLVLILTFYFGFTPVSLLTIALYLTLITLVLLIVIKTKRINDDNDLIIEEHKKVKKVSYYKNNKVLSAILLVFCIILTIIEIELMRFVATSSYPGRLDLRTFFIFSLISIATILYPVFDIILGLFLKNPTKLKFYRISKYISLIINFCLVAIFVVTLPSSITNSNHNIMLISTIICALSTTLTPIILLCTQRKIKNVPVNTTNESNNKISASNNYNAPNKQQQHFVTTESFNWQQEEALNKQKQAINQHPSQPSYEPVNKNFQQTDYTQTTNEPVEKPQVNTNALNDETEKMVKQLKQLEALKERGIFTEEEYQQKRKKIIYGE